MDLIPLPRMSEYLLDDFMIPMGLTVHEVSEGTGIPLNEMRALLADDEEVTPELSKKLGTFFGISENIFYRLQQDIDSRNARENFEPVDETVQEFALV